MFIQIHSNSRASLPILKPWGWEMEIWNSRDLGITYLNIIGGKSTSLHCHPNKRTGYIVLKGEVEVEFLAGTKRYKAGDRVNFRPSLFHRSQALTSEAILLELESPPDKNDLVRLEDPNHRIDSAYENKTIKINSHSESILKSVQESLHESGPRQKQIPSLDVSMSMTTVTPRQLLDKYEDRVIISPVNATIYTDRRHGGSKYEAIVQPGDVTTVGDLRRMARILDLGSTVTAFLVSFRSQLMRDEQT